MVSIGHWENLEEAQKLTQSHLVAGIIDEDIRMGGLISLLPLAQFAGLSAKWNRESTNVTAAQFGRGATLTWQEAAKLDDKEKELFSTYVQTLLDHFVPEIYGTINNYRAIQLMQDKKAMLNKIEDMIIYGDNTFSVDNLEFDGLHAIAQENSTNFNGDLIDIEQSGALSLANLRLLEDRMLHGVDFILVPKIIARRIDAYVQEAGLSTNLFGAISFTLNDLGRKVTAWNGIPIIRSDYLLEETADTGEGANARAKSTSGSNWSLFMVKMGQVMAAEPGLTLAFGGEGVGAGELWKTVLFPNLEAFDAAGLRLISYLGLLDGSSVAVGRITDITDAAVVA